MQQSSHAAIGLSIKEGFSLLAIGSEVAMAETAAAAMHKNKPAEVVALTAPSQRAPGFEANFLGRHVVLISYGAGIWNAYGPFSSEDKAELFAKATTQDDDYAVLSMR